MHANTTHSSAQSLAPVYGEAMSAHTNNNQCCTNKLFPTHTNTFNHIHSGCVVPTKPTADALYGCSWIFALALQFHVVVVWLAFCRISGRIYIYCAMADFHRPSATNNHRTVMWNLNKLFSEHPTHPHPLAFIVLRYEPHTKVGNRVGLGGWWLGNIYIYIYRERFDGTVLPSVGWV